MFRLCTKAVAKPKAKAKALRTAQKHKNNNKSQSHVVGKYLWLKPAKFPNFELANASEKSTQRGRKRGRWAAEQSRAKVLSGSVGHLLYCVAQIRTNTLAGTYKHTHTAYFTDTKRRTQILCAVCRVGQYLWDTRTDTETDAHTNAVDVAAGRGSSSSRASSSSSGGDQAAHKKSSGDGFKWTQNVEKQTSAKKINVVPKTAGEPQVNLPQVIIAIYKKIIR